MKKDYFIEAKATEMLKQIETISKLIGKMT